MGSTAPKTSTSTLSTSTQIPTPPSNLSVVNPLSIIFVQSGSKGDRLLFRYPYKKVANSEPRVRRQTATNTSSMPNTATTTRNVSFDISVDKVDFDPNSKLGDESVSGGQPVTSSPENPAATTTSTTTSPVQTSPTQVNESPAPPEGQGQPRTRKLSNIFLTPPVVSPPTLEKQSTPPLSSSSPELGQVRNDDQPILTPPPLTSVTTPPTAPTPNPATPALLTPSLSLPPNTSPPQPQESTTATATTIGIRETRSGSMSSVNLRPRKTSTRTNPFPNLINPTQTLKRQAGPAVTGPTFGPNLNLSDVFLDDDISESGQDQMYSMTQGDGNKMLSELSDKDLSNLLAVNSDLSERKFELKLNFVRFVGHPTLMYNPNSYRAMHPTSQTSSVKLFHIVFCLNAVASHSIVKCFHDLSKRLGIALRHEEYRCGYLNKEMKKVIALHDEACTVQSDDWEDEEALQHRVFDDILQKSNLAQLLKRVYEDVSKNGYTFVRVNSWIQISFCLPQKIHFLPFRSEQTPLVEPEAIHRCLEAIRPYHAILLLVDPDELSQTLWLDASSTIARLIQVYSPLKSLQTSAADADLTLSQVVEIASHLVYWARATVIYPLCESNIYVVAQDICVTGEELRREFCKKFPGLSLTQVLADFSLPMELGERVNPVVGGNYMQAQQVHLVTWMLKYHLLIHLHTYVYLTTYFDGSMLESGMDYLAAFKGVTDGYGNTSSGNFSLNIRPYEADEDEDAEEDATASDTFSETTAEIENGDEKRPESKNSENLEENQNQEKSERVETDKERKLKVALDELNEAVRRGVNMVKTKLSLQDIKMFSRLSKYFTGDFHFEEIMYRENVRRSQLMLLLDKFRDVLVTVEKEDKEINFFTLPS